MGDGFIQLLVIGFFIVISIMDGAARKKRQAAQLRGELPGPDGPSEIDDDERVGEGSSEGMVPEDLWGEIAALARGEHPAQRTDPPPAPDAESPTVRRTESRTVSRAAQRSTRMAAYDGTDTGEAYDRPDTVEVYDRSDIVSEPERATVTAAEVQPVPVQARRPFRELPHEHVLHSEIGMADSSDGAARTSREKGALREPMGRVTSLRRAIVMAEVLRPPVALRVDNGEPYG
jgi:hypothetical protein